MEIQATTSSQSDAQTKESVQSVTLENIRSLVNRRVTAPRLVIVFALMLLFMVVLLFVGGLVGYFISQSLGQKSNHTTSSQTLDALFKEQGLSLSLGMRNDYLLQDCGEGNHLKQSFPDVDYSFFGYNILKGYPLAGGIDPGFTLPIFRGDYSTGRHSDDCRFSVPKGLVVVPDISCVTSFTSEIIKTQHAYAKSLSVSAGVDAGGWGVSFSLSAGYKRASSELGSGEKVFVISTAKCHYYMSKLVSTSAPPFNPDFIEWIKKLEQSDNEETYMQFFDTYGTHYPHEIVFGARYTFEHSMTNSEYDSKESSSKNVAMSASYHGLFSVGASLSMDSSQEQMAKDFRQNVETKTVTVGAAPPADGDAMKWASSVQNNPVPVYYRLSSIEKLFTADFMEGSGIDYVKIQKNLLKYKHGYQFFLHKKELLKSCLGADQTFVSFYSTAFSKYQYRENGTLEDCLATCFKHPDCLGISMLKNTCYFTPGQDLMPIFNFVSTAYILWKDNRKTIDLFKTAINGVAFKEPLIDYNLTECKDLCMKHDRCFAITFKHKCMLYEREGIKWFDEDVNAYTMIVSKCADLDVALGQHLLNV